MVISQTFHLGTKIEREQNEFFIQYGFLHFKKFIGDTQVQKTVLSLEATSNELIMNKVEKINGVPIKFGQLDDGRKFVQRLPFANCVSPEVRRIFSDDRLYSLQALIPDSASRFGTEEKDGAVFNYFVNSEGSNFKQMGWHVDVMRELVTNLKYNEMINVGIYLDNSNAENGGLRIIPKSHTQSLYRMFTSKLSFFDNKPDMAEFLIEAEAGDLVIHHGKLWHRVAKSPYEGARSIRRVIYLPVITGKKSIKNKESRIPFYHRLDKYVNFK